MRIDEISLGQIGAGIKGAVAGAQQSAQTRKVSQNTQALAQTALSQWGKKVIALTNAAGGQPVSNDEYNDHLKDFVQKVMLNNRQIDQLDANSQSRIDAGIDAVMNNRNDRQKLPQAFNQLVTAASVARDDPSKTQYAASSAAASGTAQQLNPTQAASAVKQIMRSANVNTQAVATALQQTTGGTVAVPRTNSTVANALLKALGFDVK